MVQHPARGYTGGELSQQNFENLPQLTTASTIGTGYLPEHVTSLEALRLGRGIWTDGLLLQIGGSTDEVYTGVQFY